MLTATIKDPHLLPYGVYIAEGTSVLYDRKYRPIVRMPGRWPDCDSASTTVVDPTEWITHDTQEWFYNDGSIPRRNKKTRETLQSLVDKIPALASEIERRDRKAERAEKAENNDRLKYYRKAQLSPSSQAKLREWNSKREEEMSVVQFPKPPTREDAQAALDAFCGVATQAETDAWVAKYGQFWQQMERTEIPIVSERKAQATRKQATDTSERVDARRFDAASLHGKPVPDREWLVPGLIPAGNVTLLYGDGGTGKSLLALQLAATKVRGGMFFGRPVKQGKCEFLTAEDSRDEIHRRLADIARIENFPLSELAGLSVTSLVDTDALLAVEGGDVLTETPLYKKLETILAESRPDLLVLDTLADVFGGNEVVRAQARRFVAMLRKLCLSYGCTVIVLAHPSLSGMDKGTSGSTGWNNSVRSRLFFARMVDADGTEPDEDARVLRVGKLNYGRVGTEIPMRWKAGAFVGEGGDAGPDPLTQRWKAERVFLELLDRANKHHEHVSSKKGANYAPAVFAREALKQGVKKRDLVDVMNHMLDSGKIENTPHGSPSRMRYWLERVAIPPSKSVFPPSLPPSFPPTLPPSST